MSFIVKYFTFASNNVDCIYKSAIFIDYFVLGFHGDTLIIIFVCF